MNKEQQIREIENIIKAECGQWLETMGVTTIYYADCFRCAVDSAEALYNAGYRKISEGTLVLTKEELVKMMESGYVYDMTSGNKINIIEMAREIARKETATEILQTLYNECSEITDETGEGMGYFVIDDEILCLAKQYGVEVDV